jgi:hypothetical protein
VVLGDVIDGDAGRFRPLDELDPLIQLLGEVDVSAPLDMVEDPELHRASSFAPSSAGERLIFADNDRFGNPAYVA